MAEPTEPIFFGSRRKSALGVALCLGTVSLGWWFTTFGDTVRRSAEFYGVLGWLLIVLFGLLGSAWLASLIIPHRLWIEHDGFSVKRAWSGKKRYRWGEIEDIFVHYNRGSSMVVWRDKKSNGSLTRTLFGCDNWLPGGWELSPDEIAGELNYLREQHRC